MEFLNDRLDDQKSEDDDDDDRAGSKIYPMPDDDYSRTPYIPSILSDEQKDF